MAFIYFNIEYAIKTHDFIIEKSGGAHGENDLGLLESVLDHIQNDFYYPDFEAKITHLVFSVNKNHAFSDGNKRSSIALGAYFLGIPPTNPILSKHMRKLTFETKVIEVVQFIM